MKIEENQVRRQKRLSRDKQNRLIEPIYIYDRYGKVITKLGLGESFYFNST